MGVGLRACGNVTFGGAASGLGAARNCNYQFLVVFLENGTAGLMTRMLYGKLLGLRDEALSIPEFLCYVKKKNYSVY